MAALDKDKASVNDSKFKNFFPIRIGRSLWTKPGTGEELELSYDPAKGFQLTEWVWSNSLNSGGDFNDGISEVKVYCLENCPNKKMDWKQYLDLTETAKPDDYKPAASGLYDEDWNETARFKELYENPRV